MISRGIGTFDAHDHRAPPGCIDPGKGFTGVSQSSGYFGQQRRLGNAIFCRAVP
jgi:hypothetical protein